MSADAIDGVYLILCRRGAPGALLWWAVNSAGYTVDVDLAGHYSRAEAEAQQRSRPRVDVAVPLHVALAYTRRIVRDAYVHAVLADAAAAP